jgi:hypothetical protein
MRRRLGATLFVVAAAATLACRRSAPGRIAPIRPSGNGVWFAEGFAGEADQAQAETALRRGGFSWVLLPAARLERRGNGWVIVRLAPPPRPMSGFIVSPVVIGGKETAAALASEEASARRALEDALVLAVRTVVQNEARRGPLGGVHLDLPLTVETATPCAAILRRMRSRTPSGLFLSLTLKFPPPDGARKKLWPLAAAVDGFVAMVFGEDENADPAETDRLARPWWAGYAPNAEGRWKNRRGEDRGALPEGFLARLSDDPRVEFQHDMEVEERAGFGYLFRARRPVVVQGRRFDAGDEVEFRQPFLTDMVRAFGQDIKGRRFSKGRVIRLSGRSDSDRIFTLAALNEIQISRSLAPRLRISVERGAGTVSVSAENTSPLPSILSRVTNWIEVDLTRPGIRDVQLQGGFDRFEVYAPDGRRVSPGRSSRVRFYETLVGPFERIAPAVIFVRPPVPPDCCRIRYHLLSAAGPELTTDWQAAGQ